MVGLFTKISSIALTYTWAYVAALESKNVQGNWARLVCIFWQAANNYVIFPLRTQVLPCKMNVFGKAVYMTLTIWLDEKEEGKKHYVYGIGDCTY